MRRTPLPLGGVVDGYPVGFRVYPVRSATVGCGVNCPSCEAVTADGLLCSGCTGRLRSALLAVARLWPDLEVTLSRQARTGTGGKRTDPSPLPVDVEALKAYSYVRNQLATWGAAAGCGLSDPRSRALWLAANVEACRALEDAAGMLGELEYCRTLIRRVVDLPPELLYCGSCQVCGNYLYAKTGTDNVTCRRCVKAGIDTPAVPVEARRGEMRAAAEDLLVTMDELLTAVPALYGVPVRRNTVSVWVHRGRLLPHGADPQLFRIGDVLDLVHGMTARAS